jgi:DNA-directed RNA polymerase subunit RPC12/RpoP
MINRFIISFLLYSRSKDEIFQGMDNRDEIVVLGEFQTSIEANIVKSKLDAYGIPCFLTEENMANLHLFSRDVERAKHILEENHLVLDDDSVIRCPRCKSRKLERDFPKKFSLTFASALNTLFFGVFFPHKKVFRCLECDYEFKD